MEGGIGIYEFPEEETGLTKFEYKGAFIEKPLVGEDTDISFETTEGERERVEVGLDLANWRYAIMTPEMRQDIADNGIKLFSKWTNFWAALQPVTGIDSPEILQALSVSTPVKVIGPRQNLISYADSYKEIAEDALYFLWDLAQSADAEEYKQQLLRLRIPPEVRIPIEALVQNLMDRTSVHESRDLHRKLLEAYKSAIIQFRSPSSLYSYRDAHPGSPHPTNLIYNNYTRMAPWQAAVAAEVDDSIRYSLNLNEVKRGIKTGPSKSYPNSRTKPVIYRWQNIIKHLVDYTDVIVVNADMTQLAPETKGLNFGMIDEFTQIVRGMPTQLGKMLNDIKALKYSGLIVIETPSPITQRQRLGREIDKTAFIIQFIQSHFNPDAREKPSGGKKVH